MNLEGLKEFLRPTWIKILFFLPLYSLLTGIVVCVTSKSNLGCSFEILFGILNLIGLLFAGFTGIQYGFILGMFLIAITYFIVCTLVMGHKRVMNLNPKMVLAYDVIIVIVLVSIAVFASIPRYMFAYYFGDYLEDCQYKLNTFCVYNYSETAYDSRLFVFTDTCDNPGIEWTAAPECCMYYTQLHNGTWKDTCKSF